MARGHDPLEKIINSKVTIVDILVRFLTFEINPHFDGPVAAACPFQNLYSG